MKNICLNGLIDNVTPSGFSFCGIYNYYKNNIPSGLNNIIKKGIII